MSVRTTSLASTSIILHPFCCRDWQATTRVKNTDERTGLFGPIDLGQPRGGRVRAMNAARVSRTYRDCPNFYGVVVVPGADRWRSVAPENAHSWKPTRWHGALHRRTAGSTEHYSAKAQDFLRTRPAERRTFRS